MALIGVVVVALVAIVGYRRAGVPRPAGDGVSIRIVAHDPTEVTIDGHPAGKTPLTLERPRTTRPIVIAGPRGATQVVPDHDQTVDLSPP